MLKKQYKNQLLKELEKITLTMNIPQYRKTSVHWLYKNIHKKNKNHKNLEKAKKIISTLMKMGVQN